MQAGEGGLGRTTAQSSASCPHGHTYCPQTAAPSTPPRGATHCPPNSCMPSRAKTTMNRKSRKSRLMMDFMELSRDTTRFRSEFQYLWQMQPRWDTACTHRSPRSRLCPPPGPLVQRAGAHLHSSRGASSPHSLNHLCSGPRLPRRQSGQRASSWDEAKNMVPLKKTGRDRARQRGGGAGPGRGPCRCQAGSGQKGRACKARPS